MAHVEGGGGPVGGGTAFDTIRVAGDSDRYANCRTGADANQRTDCAVAADIDSIQEYWTDELPRPAPGLHAYVDALWSLGATEAELRQMVCENPARLLRLRD